jgi:hypothetical protein
MPFPWLLQLWFSGHLLFYPYSLIMKHRQTRKETRKMPETRRRKIEKHKRNIAEHLDELDQADDADLWEEADAKLHDVLVVYRRVASDPEMASLSDEQLAQIAFRDAVEGFLLSRGSVACPLREGDGA